MPAGWLQGWQHAGGSGLSKILLKDVWIVVNHRPGRLVEQPESGREHAMLVLRVQRLAERPTEGKLAKECSRRPESFRDVTHRRKPHGGDAG
jgi:hypothetical protein